ncbi:MAG: DUF1127 domain-containing protein [Pseudomonadota bacterium]
MTRTVTFPPDALAYLGATRHAPKLAVIAVQFAVCVSKWASRRRTRQALAQLDIWQLDDVGLTPKQAHREASKEFWRP